MRIEARRRRIEWAARDRRVDVILSGNRVGCKEIDNFCGAKACVPHAGEDRVDRVAGMRYKVRRGCGVVGTASKKLESSASDTVANGHSTGKLNTKIVGAAYNPMKYHQMTEDSQIAEGHIVPERNGFLLIDNFIHAQARSVAGLNVDEGHNGTISSSTAERSSISPSSYVRQIRVDIPKLACGNECR